MNSPNHPPSAWQLLALAAAFLLCLGNSHSVSGQFFPGEKSGPTIANRAPNPQTKRLSDKHLSKNQRAIEQAIEVGNRFRDDNSYYQAFAHYQKAQKMNQREARAYYGLGNLYSDLYCKDSAIENYLKALKLRKNYLEARIGLGYAYINAQRYDQSLEQFQMALALASNNVEANIGMGRAYAKKGKYQEAITQINHVINAKAIKDQARAYVALGDVYNEKDAGWKEVTVQYQKAISLKPDLAEAYIKLGLPKLFSITSKTDFRTLKEAKPQDLENLRITAKQAADSIKRAIDLKPDEPEAYLYLGLALAFQFRYQEAIIQLNVYSDKIKKIESQLSSLAPECNSGFNYLNAKGYTLSGFVYGLEGKLENIKERETNLFKEAIKCFNQAIELKQDDPLAYGLLADIYFSQGNYEEAIRQFKKEILFDATDSAKADTYGRIAHMYRMLERNAEAIDQLREAIRLDPNNPSFYEAFAAIYLVQGKIDESRDMLKKALELEPEADASLYFKLAIIYGVKFAREKNEADFNEAIKLFKRSVEIKPDYVDAYEAMGYAYKIRANADEALASFKKALEYAPKNPEIYIDIAHVYFDLKQNADAAIKFLKDAIELKPDSVRARLYLGHIYRHQNDDNEAIKQIVEAIKIDPQQLQAHLDLADIYKIQKNYPEAIKYLKKATEIAPTDFRPYLDLAQVYEVQGTSQDAAHYYSEAANRLDAANSFNKNLYLGRAARLRGRYEDAINYFQMLIPLKHPRSAYYEMGMTYVASGNKSAALEQYQKLVQLKSPLAEELLKKINKMK